MMKPEKRLRVPGKGMRGASRAAEAAARGASMQPAPPESERLRRLVAGWDRVVQVNIPKEGDFHIDIERGNISYREGEHPSPSLRIKAGSDVIEKILSGQLDPIDAFMSGELEVDGCLEDAARFRLGVKEVVQQATEKRVRLTEE